MKKPLLFSLCLLFVNASWSQLTVDTTQTPAQIIEDVFLSNGIFISNVTFNGSGSASLNAAVGSFSAFGTGLGIDQGILMTSGSAMNVIGPNDEGSSTANVLNGVMNDPDIDVLITSSSYDGSILEFDFIATGDSLDFVYIFGSEEYEEFVGSSFNDVFGFFISGPGITGPFINGALNIAQVPETGEPVAINTVNGSTNSQYFVLNNGQVDIQYDGLTIPMHASIGGLSIGEVYHIKLAVADVMDSALDSGVFLSGSSFVQLCTDDGDREGECLLCSIQAHVDYTESCGTITLTNTSEVNIPTTGCEFFMGDGTVLNSCDGTVNYTYDEPGTYPVSLYYYIDGFYTSFDIGEIYISDLAPAAPVITQEGYDLVVTNFDGVSFLQWYLEGMAIAGATGSSYTPAVAGHYTVAAINGCMSISEVFNAVTIGITDNDMYGMQLFPNPTSGNFIITCPNNTHVICIADITGKTISTDFTKGRERMEFNIPGGVYSVSALDKNGQRMDVRKVIVN